MLVVAIGHAMSPPRALPREKIHPFYLRRFSRDTTLVLADNLEQGAGPAVLGQQFLEGPDGARIW